MTDYSQQSLPDNNTLLLKTPYTIPHRQYDYSTLTQSANSEQTQWPGQTSLRFRTNRRHIIPQQPNNDLPHPLYYMQSKRHFDSKRGTERDWRPSLRISQAPPLTDGRESMQIRHLVENITIVKPRIERFQFVPTSQQSKTSLGANNSEYDEPKPRASSQMMGTRRSSLAGSGQSLADIIAHAQNFLYRGKGVKARMVEEEVQRRQSEVRLKKTYDYYLRTRENSYL
ncbi:hypothetical protein FGO68_gene8393 [Halteria grandinella]|uniref:Uncharacterized protein n=1 Tax=Halteria grandinella TaxID=5974 RepID=A0A8J8SW39_HALGN|nr:hypothetical protein FGO68_gene8393 [Halteria grandinella]